MGEALHLMKFFKIMSILLIFLAKVKRTFEQNQFKQFTYNAAVVEYQTIQNLSMSHEEKQDFTVNEYTRIVKEIKKLMDIDIILFPESTLTSPLSLLKPESVTEVPEPLNEVLCNSSNLRYLSFLKKLSCAAMEANTTLVINIIEKENCTLNNVPGFCPSTGLVYYNSDVILNEKGSVSARYRKYNLYGEAGLTPPPQLEVVNFTIRNNVTFGIFTCFDILFDEPAMMLVRNGVRNILFPTMWFSQLPYLTALQVQQMWAHENNVTLLSASANNPQVGNGGSGIFIGNKSPLNYTIVGGTGGTAVLIHRVPRIEVAGNPFLTAIKPLQQNVDALAENLDDFRLKQDCSLINGHTSVVLDPKKNETKVVVCNGNKNETCCHFHIKINSAKHIHESKNIYTYHLAAFQRVFKSNRQGGIEGCSVLACQNSSISSCAQRFPKFKDIQWPITIAYINITAEFPGNNKSIQFPNSLLASLTPISPQYTSWLTERSEHKVKRTHLLNKPQNRLLTFAIYGRNFGNTLSNFSSSQKIKSQYHVVFVIMIFSFLIIFNKI